MTVLSVLRSLNLGGPLDEKGPDPKDGCFCQGEPFLLPAGESMLKLWYQPIRSFFDFL